eukprot:1897826-Amphidinium_carterae.1
MLRCVVVLAELPGLVRLVGSVPGVAYLFSLPACLACQPCLIARASAEPPWPLSPLSAVVVIIPM